MSTIEMINQRLQELPESLCLEALVSIEHLLRKTKHETARNEMREWFFVFGYEGYERRRNNDLRLRRFEGEIPLMEYLRS